MNSTLFSRVSLNKHDEGFSAATVIPMGDKSLVFISGEVGRDSGGRIVAGGFENEVRQCFANIERALKACNAGFPDVVRITAYLKDLAQYAVYAQVRNEVFGDAWPASASVGVHDLLLGAQIEIDAIAVVTASSS